MTNLPRLTPPPPNHRPGIAEQETRMDLLTNALEELLRGWVDYRAQMDASHERGLKVLEQARATRDDSQPKPPSE